MHTLDEALGSYPNLRMALGERWIRHEESVDALLSEYRIARWLKIGVAGHILSTLDEVLASVQGAGLDGISSHLRPLRTADEQFLETCSELYLIDWLIRHPQYPLALPGSGADLLIDLGGPEAFAFEVTVPRKTAWLDTLYDRLATVGSVRSFRGCMEYESDTVNVAYTESVQIIVDAVMDRMDSVVDLPVGERTFCQSWEEFGISLSWEYSDEPYLVSTSATHSVSPLAAFELVVAAAQSKSHQLPAGRSGGLVLGVSQAPIAMNLLIDLIRRDAETGSTHSSEMLREQWLEVPNQIKHICLYEMSLDRRDPFRATWLKNPFSEFEDPPSLSAFMADLSY